MTSAAPGLRPRSIAELKRRMAEALVRSKLDYTDDILILNAFLHEFRWRETDASADEVASIWSAHLKRPRRPEHAFSLYLHIPYCVKKCFFCYCAMRVTTNHETIDRYVPELEREIAFYAPLFRDVRFQNVRIGGGTPSLLSEAQLRDLLRCAASSFSIAEDAVRVIEFNPASTTIEKLATARAFGFNRVSFGVQSLNPRVLKKENREYQTYEMTRDAVFWAQDAGFEIVNIDLIVGLTHDTPEEFLDGFERIAQLKPTSIAVPGLTLTDAYLKVMKTTREQNQRHYDDFLPKALQGMRDICGRYGYDASTLIPGPGHWMIFQNSVPEQLLDRLRRGDVFFGGPVSVLGLGHNARSHLFGDAICSRRPAEFSQSAPLYRIAPLELKQEMIRQILYALENSSRVDFSDFELRFGRDVRREFETEIKALRCLGQVRIDSKGIEFLPSQGTGRIFYGMFFLLDVLTQAPFARGLFEAPFLDMIKKDLSGVALGEDPAPKNKA